TRKAVVQPAEEKKPEEKKPETKPEAKKPTAEVSGIVTLDGKPLADGTLTLHGAGDKTHTAAIKDGKYDLKGVPPGTYQVAVKAKDAKAGVPARYADADKSGLTVAVRPGRTSY